MWTQEFSILKKEDADEMPEHPAEKVPYLFNAEFKIDILSKPIVIPC